MSCSDDENYQNGGGASMQSSLKEDWEEDNQNSDRDEEYMPSSSESESNDSDNDQDLDSDCSDYCEDDVIREVENKQLFTTKVIKSFTTKTGKKKKIDRTYNVKHFCPFCKKLVLNFSQHIISKLHSQEPQIVQINKVKETARQSKEKIQNKNRLITLLRNKADNQHNCQVIKRKAGEVIIGRRLKQGPFDINCYGPCPRCLEWLRLTVLKRHQKKCPGGSNVPLTIGDLMVQSSVISGRIDGNPSQQLLTEVYPIMKKDRIGTVAREDPLIVLLGNQWLRRNVGNVLMRKYYTSGVMRLCSRLLITF